MSQWITNTWNWLCKEGPARGIGALCVMAAILLALFSGLKNCGGPDVGQPIQPPQPIQAINTGGAQIIGSGNSFGDVTVTHGANADELIGIAEWYASEETSKREEAEARAEQLATKLDVSDKAILSFLAEFGHADLPREQWPQKLQELAAQFAS